MRRAAALLALLTALGCDDGPGPGDAGADAAAPPAPTTLGPADRPASLVAPPAHDGVTPLPLVVLLHGYTVTALAEDTYLGVTRSARSEGVYVLLPDGTIDPSDNPYWDVYGLAVDDLAYLRGLIEEARAALPVSDVFVVGHSNGGFMAYRLACDAADLVSGIASLAGSDAITSCAPSAPVAVLQIHGTADDTVLYDGGEIAGLPYASAEATVMAWADRLGCGASTSGGALDLLADVDGAETEVTAWDEGCEGAATVELWTMRDGGHIPAVQRDFTARVLGWLRARAR